MSHKHITAVYNLASVADIEAGMTWYASAKRIAKSIAAKYNLHPHEVAGVIAALSPRNKWERNIADAENLIKVWVTDPESVDTVKVCTFGANKAKAIRILQAGCLTDADVLAILSGPKLREFYSCIVGIPGEVCIDGHAYSVWAGDRITLANVPSIGIKLRRQIKADYATAADQAGITAYEMQAVTWTVWRRIHGVA